MPERQNFVATIGFFDGVHVGHRFLLQQLVRKAEALGKPSLVISFAAHPQTVLHPEIAFPLLTTNAEKTAILDSLGIDACVFLHFDRQMSQMSAADFLEQIVVGKLGVQTLLIGYDHRFGQHRSEGFEQYVEHGRRLGLDVVQVAPYEQGEVHASSSAVRKLLLGGGVEEAARLLSYHYTMQGRVVHGEQLGATLGFPTANIEPLEANKILPSNGVYAISVELAGKLYAGMLNIGVRPTVSAGKQKSIEVHILNFNQNIYGQTVKLSFYRKIRDEKRFPSKDELVAQLVADRDFLLSLGKFYQK